MLQSCFRMSASWAASLDELGRAHSYHWDQGRFFERFLDTWVYDLSASAMNRVLEKNCGASTLCLTHSLLIIFWRFWIITAPGSHVGQHCNTLFCATCSLRRLLIIFIMSSLHKMQLAKNSVLRNQLLCVLKLKCFKIVPVLWVNYELRTD